MGKLYRRDGRIDLPYEQLVVATSITDRTRIVAFPVNVSGDTYWRFAKYSTEEKAEKAMEMLRTEYGNLQETISGNGKYFALDHPKVFRFPQDSKV